MWPTLLGILLAVAGIALGVVAALLHQKSREEGRDPDPQNLEGTNIYDFLNDLAMVGVAVLL